MFQRSPLLLLCPLGLCNPFDVILCQLYFVFLLNSSERGDFTLKPLKYIWWGRRGLWWEWRSLVTNHGPKQILVLWSWSLIPGMILFEWFRREICTPFPILINGFVLYMCQMYYMKYIFFMIIKIWNKYQPFNQKKEMTFHMVITNST